MIFTSLTLVHGCRAPDFGIIHLVSGFQIWNGWQQEIVRFAITSSIWGQSWIPTPRHNFTSTALKWGNQLTPLTKWLQSLYWPAVCLWRLTIASDNGYISPQWKILAVKCKYNISPWLKVSKKTHLFLSPFYICLNWGSKTMLSYQW